ncbi:multicopper oxidase family protein [Streptosporangium amethystogenes]|uniref:multicopper oxidase family protein n=1 Tax=Streptosporangium amethystogenes TaxID=2002 RepID=UPI00068DD25A|nr:multicopper oxidase family protein [Streptosporangium amethystogenes]
MNTAQLLALDRILLVLVAALWLGAGVSTVMARRDRRTRLIALGLTLAALAATGLRVGLAVALSRSGWWFAADKLTLALPLVGVPALVAAVAALPRLLRPSPSPATAVPALTAGYGALGGVIAALTISHPVPPVMAGVLVALVVVGATITWRLLGAVFRTEDVETANGTVARGRWSTTAGTAVLCAALVWAGLSAWSSRIPATLDLGAHHRDGAQSTARPAAATRAVTDLRGPAAGAKVRRFTLTAKPATVSLASGRRVEAWTFDGTVPGPTIRVRQGELVEVRLRNAMPGIGVTLHWHGYDVPVGEDGVAGVTQDAVKPGGEFVYRFLAEDPGSYWYHSHDLSDPAVRMGLYGMLVVDPAATGEGTSPPGLPDPSNPPGSPSGAAGGPLGSGSSPDAVAKVSDHTVSTHVLGGVQTVAVDDEGPVDGLARLGVTPGTPVRLRVTATDNVRRTLGLSGTPYRIAAVDGRDLSRPGEIGDRRVQLAAGGRYDLTFTMPATPVLLSVDGRSDLGLLVTPGSGTAPTPAAGPLLDIATYDSDDPAKPGRPDRFDREVTWILDRGLAMLDGVPTLAHTVNGEVWPRITTPVLREGELVRITVANRSGDVHPIHPHGHHVRVLSRNGVPATGELWMDTFDVGPGEVWEVALRADNPGIWMSHCHDLGHAALGMTFHFAYEGVTTPYDAGHASGNNPE